jgi:hypothetical protein
MNVDAFAELLKLLRLAFLTNLGCAIAEAVTRQLLTTVARFLFQVGPVAFVVVEMSLGLACFQCLGFPYEFSFYQVLQVH